MEGHDPGVLGTGLRGPGDPLVRRLLGDDGVELLLASGDLRAPVQVGVVDLADFLDALHERRELLELRPLVVGGADGDVHVDALLDVGHEIGLPGPAECRFVPSSGFAPGCCRRVRDPCRSMPLTLVTGPANAEKAGAVLGAYRAALEREPLLVVPTAADADHYRREL